MPNPEVILSLPFSLREGSIPPHADLCRCETEDGRSVDIAWTEQGGHFICLVDEVHLYSLDAQILASAILSQVEQETPGIIT